MTKNGTEPRHEDTKQVSNIIAVVSIIGLTVCFVAASREKIEIPLILYAIFGGGVLGTDSVLKFLKAIFRIGHDG